MSFISPLEALADKFNIINYNIRELLFKLSVWKDTDANTVIIRLKTADAPYFEHYEIPSMKYIRENGKKTNWGSFKPEGTKNWSNTITSDEFEVEVNGVKFHNINIDSLNYPKTHFMTYNGDGKEGDVKINLVNSGSEINSMFEFIVTVQPTVNNTPGENFIYFIDGGTSSILLKLGSHDLVNLLESYTIDDGRKYPKKFKVSFQYVVKPGDVDPSWVIFDLYQMPRFEYDVSSTSTLPISY